MTSDQITIRAKRIESPTSDLNWDIYLHTVKKWINSCKTLEQLEKTLPFIVKYHYSSENKKYRDVIKEANLYKLFWTKLDLIPNEIYLEKLNSILEKYDNQRLIDIIRKIK